MQKSTEKLENLSKEVTEGGVKAKKNTIEKEQAREGLKMIRDDYKGTDTSTRASEALKAISR